MKTTPVIWRCQTCGKEFAKSNQSHKCEKVDIELLFSNKREKLFDIYQNLLKILKLNGSYKVTTSCKAITLYTDNGKAFLVIEPKKSFIDIWFLLERREDVFPVFKILQPSKTRFAHFVRLYDIKDIDGLIINWIAESYDLVRFLKKLPL